MFPRIPNRYDDDEQRLKRLETQGDDAPRRPLIFFVAGLLLLGLEALLSRVGWGGAGLLVVPIGVALVLVGAIQLALARLSG